MHNDVNGADVSLANGPKLNIL